MPELVLYGIRELAKQFLGAILDIEVDQSDHIRSHTKGLMLAVLKPGEMTSLYQPSEASLATSFIN